MLTGESRPLARGPGECVVGGSVNRGNPVEMKVERIGGDTVLSHVTRLLDRAQSQRPALARTADVVARWFVAGVLVIAAGIAALWSAVDPAAAFEVTLSVLVVTCPCALSLATPTALTAATARLARSGLLVTRGDALEPLAHADWVVLDKTGTLTQGRVNLVEVHALGDLPREDCLRIAAALERASEHPLAAALRLPDAPDTEDTVVFPGEGIEGIVNGRRFRIGTPSFVADLYGGGKAPGNGVGHSVIRGSVSGPLAAFSFDDAVRPDAATTLAGFRASRLEVEIASGDSDVRVKTLAEDLGIRRLNWRQSPEDKLGRIRALQSAGHKVVMVGDGVNDAPVLAGADVSVAMGAGAPLAQTTADMILLGESLSPLSTGINTARRTLRIIRQNIAWAVLYNLTALPMAAAGLVAPWMAAIGMSASSLLVVLNSARLSRMSLRSSSREDGGALSSGDPLPAPGRLP
jgi:Cu2+-exporting ATPase